MRSGQDRAAPKTSGVAQACGVEAPLLAACRNSWAATETRLGSGADQSALIHQRQRPTPE
jgi:hypothetical protein